MKQAIKQFIQEELLEDDEPLNDDENLLADGMVDSLGMLQLIGFIEQNFAITIPPEDFTIDNFRTLELLEAYLALKQSDQSSSTEPSSL